jgi:methionine aminotransferase
VRLSLEPSIFAQMTALAKVYQALNLAQGLMELPPDPYLLSLLQDIAQTSCHQYSLPAGLIELRQVVAALSEKYFGAPYDPETEVSISVGATEGIYAAILALTRPGDKVVLLEPAYDSYWPGIKLAGAEAVPLRLEPPSFNPPWQAIEEAFRKGARLCLLNFPHNPTGRRLYPEDLATFHALAQKYPQVLFVVDQAYELMVWEKEADRPAQPLSFRQNPLLRARSVMVGSLGKLLGMTGWRLGYTLAPPELTEAIRAVRQFISFCAPTYLQEVAATYLAEDLGRATYFHEALLERRRVFRELMAEVTAFNDLTCEGSYFFLLPIWAFTAEPDRVFAERLTREYGVATIPLSPFYHDGYDPGYVRLCFARPLEVLREGARRLGRAFPKAALPTAHRP